VVRHAENHGLVTAHDIGKTPALRSAAFTARSSTLVTLLE
jgi:hypothetical protein